MRARITLEDTERGVVAHVHLEGNGVTDSREQSLAAGAMTILVLQLANLHRKHALNFINVAEIFG